MRPAAREPGGFSRRETQLMDALFALGEASVGDVRRRLPDPPTATAVRTLLGLLVKKGHVRCRREGRRNLYRAAVPRDRAGQSALRRVLEVFYRGSLSNALAAHFSDPRHKPSDEEYARLSRLIRDARARNR